MSFAECSVFLLLRKGNDGAFLLCSFWLADAYTMCGRHRDAKRLFERLLKLRNDVGPLSEEYDVVRRRLVGNFPQAFSPIARINKALNLRRFCPHAEKIDFAAFSRRPPRGARPLQRQWRGLDAR